MGFIFRKRIRLFKGVYINIGKNGASLSLGGGGCTANINSKGAKSTFGIKGTGIRYETKRTKGGSGCFRGFGCLLILVVIGALLISFFIMNKEWVKDKVKRWIESNPPPATHQVPNTTHQEPHSLP